MQWQSDSLWRIGRTYFLIKMLWFKRIYGRHTPCKTGLNRRSMAMEVIDHDQERTAERSVWRGFSGERDGGRCRD